MNSSVFRNFITKLNDTKRRMKTIRIFFFFVRGLHTIYRKRINFTLGISKASRHSIVFPSLDAHQQIKREFYSCRVEIDIEGRSKVIVAASVTVSLSASMHNGYFPRAHCSLSIPILLLLLLQSRFIKEEPHPEITTHTHSWERNQHKIESQEDRVARVLIALRVLFFISFWVGKWGVWLSLSPPTHKWLVKGKEEISL